MLKKTKKEIYLTILFCLIAIGSVIAIQVSLLIRLLSGNAWIALTVGLFVILTGSVYGIFKYSFSIKPSDAELGKEPIQKTLIWNVVATVSGAGAVLSLYFGYIEIIDLSSIPAIVMINLLAAFLSTLFLLSVIILISSIKRKKEELDSSEIIVDV